MNSTIARKLSSIAVVASAFVGAGTFTGASEASASATVYAPSFDCETQSVAPAYQTSIGTLEEFVYSTDNGASYNPVMYTYTSNLSQFKWGPGWYTSDWSGAATHIQADYPDNIIAYVYTWTYYGGKYHPQGWMYLGTCQANAF